MKVEKVIADQPYPNKFLTFLNDLDDLNEEYVNTTKVNNNENHIGMDVLNMEDEQKVDFFDFEKTVLNWNDFCQV